MISQEDIDAFMLESGDPLLKSIRTVEEEQRKTNTQLETMLQSIDTIVLMVNNMQRDITGMQRDIYTLFTQVEDNR